MDTDPAFLTVMAKQPFQSFTREGLAIGGIPPFVSGIRFLHHKEVISIKDVFQKEMIKQGHERRGEVDKALLIDIKLSLHRAKDAQEGIDRY